ncbi:cell division protein FtsZ [Nisaea acidiphila]|uniref:Cell division protein FtsZ n=1 Tax=Nisaea acidiphila TaxID=1862145 RepID=A0A9J7AUK4_9PROT|nr:cell division protein FtsZ [Nisaea acidiphila]UUX49085.1 cell division protein FtsZ [Nisaea acidiphila]
MTINISVPNEDNELKPRISVVGVGGAGGNAVNNMIRSNLEGVEFIVTNTDSQALKQSLADRTIQLGGTVTQGLGAGSRPDVGRAAAEETIAEIMDNLGESNMVFITAGMGGGTGSGAAPVIAQAAREQGILTVGVVTKPFHFEGQHRMRIADQAIEELTQYVDTLIIIPNQNLFRVANEKTTFADAFNMADDVLHSGVRGVTDLMIMPGLINLDFADIRTVMSEMGKAMMGTGEASGEKRAVDAAEAAINNPLLEDTTMKGARGVLINITGGMDMTLFEVDEAANRIREEVDPEANIIFGSTFDEKMEGTMRVSVVATGIAAEGMAAKRPPLTVVPTKAKAAPMPKPSADPAPAPAAAVASATPAPSAPAGDIPAISATTETVHVAGNTLVIGEMELDEAALEAQTKADAAKSTIEAEEQAAAEPKAGDSFIAPPPAVPETKASSEPDPFQAAAMANAGGREDSADKAPSLFTRMTGIGSKKAPEPAQDDRPQRFVDVNASEPKQARLGVLDQSERVAPSRQDDDLLDIPAFLRRQAN